MNKDYKDDTLWLMQGDCLERMKEIPNGSVDMILCDPPYGTTSCKWDSVIPLDKMWVELKRVIKVNGAVVMTAVDPFTCILGASNIKELKYKWVWNKTRATGHLNAKKMPMKNIEDILVFYSAQPLYNPQGLIEVDRTVHNSMSHSLRGKTTDPTSTVTGSIRFEAYKQTATNYPRQLLQFPSEGATVHPTQKPVTLMEYLIKTYTNEQETILDFTMGSGTTGVACVNTKRTFIGIEQDEKYFEVAKDRILG
jgi:DNA modification methylase